MYVAVCKDNPAHAHTRDTQSETAKSSARHSLHVKITHTQACTQARVAESGTKHTQQVSEKNTAMEAYNLPAQTVWVTAICA